MNSKSNNNKKWTDDEISFLIKNYSDKGPKYCSEILDRTIRSCELKAGKLEIPKNKIKKIYEEDNLIDIINKSSCFADCLRFLNKKLNPGNYDTLKKYILKYKISIEHFNNDNITNTLKKNNFEIKYETEEILVINSTYSNRVKLKEILYKEGLKARECELCGQGEEWKGKKMSLILDHINGVNNDNRLENLRIVCPNCNAGLETFAGRNNKLEYKEKSVKKIKKKENNLKVDNKHIDSCECGNLKLKNSKTCENCSHTNRRKVERPSVDQLLKEVEEVGYSATGRKYGVSDNAIRKWIKN